MKYFSVLPSPVAIYDEHWKERNTFVGPYYEKDTINLVCQAVGGNIEKPLNYFWPSECSRIYKKKT